MRLTVPVLLQHHARRIHVDDHVDVRRVVEKRAKANASSLDQWISLLDRMIVHEVNKHIPHGRPKRWYKMTERRDIVNADIVVVVELVLSVISTFTFRHAQEAHMLRVRH